MASGAAALGVVTPQVGGRPSTGVYLKVGGVYTDFSGVARVAQCTITQALNEVPDTATVLFRGTIAQPLLGQDIVIVDQDAEWHFGGRILAVRTRYEGKASNVVYECDCIDYTWDLNATKITKRYTAQTANAIISDLVTTFAPAGWYTSYSATFGVIDEITFTNEEFAQAISRVCERLGLYWFASYDRAVNVYSSGAFPSAGTITQTDARRAVNLAKHVDLSPVATLINARGGGAPASSDAAVGQTTLPIDDPSWYSATGGIVECGPQRLGYSGVVGAAETGSTIGKIAAPSATAITYAPGVTGTGTLAAGVYYCAYSSVTTEGETLPAAAVPVTVPANGNILFDVIAANVPTEPRVKGFYVYVGTVNGGAGTLRRFTLGYANNAPVPWTVDSVLVTDLSTATATPPPTVSTAGNSSLTIPAGSTTLTVDDLAPFPASGWAEAPGGQLVRYTGRSASSGPGTLTGIPATGIGAITAQLNSGTIRSIPHLIGIPASGEGSIAYPIAKGDEVYVFIQRWDNAAVAALAAATGGTGYRAEFLTDGRLSLKELTARADALLAFRKDPLVTVTFETRDPAVTVGKSITFNTTAPPIVGTFLIQRVTIADFPAKAHVAPTFPRRTVEASSRRFTFDDLVQQIRLLGRIN